MAAESTEPMNTRIDGTLKTWNSDKGFGFIAPSKGGQDIFVHISDYPKQGGQPKVGESLTFLVMLNKDGKKKAILVQRPSVNSTVSREGRAQSPASKGRSIGHCLLRFIAVAILVAVGYKYLAPMSSPSETLASGSIQAPTSAASSPFQCDGRKYCSQMTSCKEAKYFLKNCPNTEMDGDGDGNPCESQWCTSMFSK
jgi:cold shock CspA family protein